VNEWTLDFEDQITDGAVITYEERIEQPEEEAEAQEDQTETPHPDSSSAEIEEDFQWTPVKEGTIRILMKDCTHPDFQKKQIELWRLCAWQELYQKLEFAGLWDFNCMIGDVPCDDQNMYDGATVVFSFRTRGGAKCGEWEVQVSLQDFSLRYPAQVYEWILGTWDLPTAELEDFFQTKANMENLSSIMQVPMMSGQYFIVESEERNRREKSQSHSSGIH
jgi:hypothetical protein